MCSFTLHGDYSFPIIFMELQQRMITNKNNNFLFKNIFHKFTEYLILRLACTALAVSTHDPQQTYHLLHLLGAEACRFINHTCSRHYALSKMFYPGVNGSEFGQENVHLQFFKLPSPTFGLSSFLSAWEPFCIYLLIYFWGSVFLLSQGWPETHCTSQGSLRFPIVLSELCEYCILIFPCLAPNWSLLCFSSRLSVHVVLSDKSPAVSQDIGRSLMIFFICLCLGFLHTLVPEVGLFCWFVSRRPCLMDTPVVPSLIQDNKKIPMGAQNCPGWGLLL